MSKTEFDLGQEYSSCGEDIEEKKKWYPTIDVNIEGDVFSKLPDSGTAVISFRKRSETQKYEEDEKSYCTLELLKISNFKKEKQPASKEMSDDDAISSGLSNAEKSDAE